MGGDPKHSVHQALVCTSKSPQVIDLPMVLIAESLSPAIRGSSAIDGSVDTRLHAACDGEREDRRIAGMGGGSGVVAGVEPDGAKRGCPIPRHRRSPTIVRLFLWCGYSDSNPGPAPSIRDAGRAAEPVSVWCMSSSCDAHIKKEVIFRRVDPLLLVRQAFRRAGRTQKRICGAVIEQIGEANGGLGEAARQPAVPPAGPGVSPSPSSRSASTSWKH